MNIKVTVGQKFALFFSRIYESILSIVVRLVKERVSVLFQAIIIYNIIKNIQPFFLMLFPIIWCMLSFVAFNPNFETSIAMLFLFFPTSVAILKLILGQILCNGKLKVILGLQTKCNFIELYPITNVISYDPQVEKDKMFTLMICSILYIILVIEKKRKFGRFTELVNSMDKFEKLKSDLYEDIVMLLKFTIS